MKKFLCLTIIILFLLAGCQAASTPTAAPTPFLGSAHVELGDITMYFEAHGAGEPLLLLHGGFASADVWAEQVPVFAQEYYVVTPDSRAHGRTTDSDAPLSYHLMAEDMVRLMDHLGIASANVVGWSDGGIIGIDLAIHHPERVRALVAFGASISLDASQPAFLEQIRNTTVEDLEGWLGTDYIKMMPDPDHLPVMLEKVRTMWLTQPNFTAQELASITAPTLIMDGANDDVVRPEHAPVIAEAIPGAELLILRNTGHYTPIEMPGTWNKAVLDFLRDK